MNRNSKLMKKLDVNRLAYNIQFFASKAQETNTQPTETVPTNINIMNMVRKAMPYYYSEVIPEATAENLSQVFDKLMTFQRGRNELMEVLPTLIGIQTLDAVNFRNPLARYKQNRIAFGQTDEEIYVNMMKATDFDYYMTPDNLFKYYESNVMVAFHEVNYTPQYLFSIQWNTLRNAVFSTYGIRDMIAAKMQSAYASAEWGEYKAMLGMIDTGYEKQMLPAVTVSAVTDKDTAENLVVELQSFIGEASFPNPNNNIAGANSSCDASNLIFLMTPRVNARVTIQTLAKLYNLSLDETKARTRVVDGFEHEEIQAVALDIRCFRVRDQFREVSYQGNHGSLFYNYFLTLFEQISFSPFYPIRVFTSEKVGLTSIAGVAATGKAGQDVKIEVTPTATGFTYTPALYDYEITSTPSSKHTFMVPGSNILRIGENETTFPITVKVTYRNDPSITTTVTVSQSE